jgi:hypothetical protein
MRDLSRNLLCLVLRHRLEKERSRLGLMRVGLYYPPSLSLRVFAFLSVFPFTKFRHLGIH